MDTALPGLDLPETGTGAAYRVLARKYRPQSFDALIGQDALVRTLRNAIASGRIHHGYMLTGVRGVGKTTTARLIARALNYRGPDGTGQPTVGPTDDCPVCQAIAEGRHVDVIEMDAASNTSVEDIRDIIDGARYAPTEARYKVYIIDEVHMLSRNAFNALLKTLEEPPPSVVFILATTEIRKVPVTVLSRCMRFDLRRVPAELLSQHFASIAEAEKVTVEPEALSLIARAADGSVRDGLSLLDQAIALGDGQQVSAQEVRDMLGPADRQLVFDLMEALVAGQPEPALAAYARLHEAGAEAITVIQDLLELTPFITRAALVPDLAARGDVPEAEATRATALAGQLAMPALTRIWQVLLQGLQEIQQAPQPHLAAEMLILRLCHAAGLPDPAELVRQLTEGGGAAALAASRVPQGSGDGASANRGGHGPMAMTSRGGLAIASANPAPVMAVAPTSAPAEDSPPRVAAPTSFAEVVELMARQGEHIISGELRLMARPVSFRHGHIELEADAGVTSSFAGRVARLLGQWTGEPWVIELVTQQGGPSVREQEKQAHQQRMEEISRHPVIASINRAFPHAEIIEVRRIGEEPPGFDAPMGGSADGPDGVNDPETMDQPGFDPEDPGFDEADF